MWKGTRVAKNCTVVLTDELYQLEKSGGPPEINEASPKKK